LFQSHPVFNEPEPDAIIWRYMDFAKLVSLISKRALFFCRVSKLKDPWEGAWPVKQFEKGDISPGSAWSYIIKAREMREECAVSCWHINKGESDALWRIYSSGGQGIAIVSTFSNLTESLKNYVPSIFIGKVQYLDYEYASLPKGNIYWPVTCKRLSFVHENELRAVIREYPGSQNEPQRKFCHTMGEMVPVDIERLITSIYVSPEAEDWFVELVKKILEPVGLAKLCQKSLLLNDPPQDLIIKEYTV